MKFVIVGGDAAGMSAAMQIVRNSENPDITVLEEGEYYSYSQCGLPYWISGDVVSSEELIARQRDTFVNKYGINATIYHKVTEIDPNKKEVGGVRLDDNKSFKVSYDKLLIASGGSPIIPEWRGADLAGVHVLKTIPDAERIIEGLSEISNITIVGGGYIGLEVAESLVRLKKDVRIIQRGDSLGATFDKDMADYIYEEALNNGIEVHLNENVVEICGDKSVTGIKTDKGTYSTELVLIAVGIRPNTEFVPFIKKNESEAIVVDQYLQTSIPNILAAGDCATQYHRIKQLNDYIPLGTTANKQGQLAGLNMVGKKCPFQGVLGTGVLRFMGLTLARTGLASKEAEELNINYKTSFLQTSSNAGYLPNSSSFYIKIIYNPDNYKLLGAQAIGQGADKRIDVIATALFADLKLPDLLALDLAYAPPYNSVWDPIQQLTRRIT